MSLEPQNIEARGALSLAKRQLTRGEDGPPTSEAGGEIFVGRQEEMRSLRGALDRSIAGVGSVVMITGEPGIGKTRISQELSRAAESLGVLVLTGRNAEGGGAPPHWPWIQAFRGYPWEMRREHLSTVLGDVLGLLAPLVAGAAAVPQELSADASATDRARFQFYDATAGFLREASKLQAILIVLEDLHWSDESSLGLLEHVATELPHSHTLVVGTYRDVELSRRHRLYSTLAELTREQLMLRVPLRRLSRSETAGFLHSTTHIDTPEQWADTLFERSEGNPLFAMELVRWLDRPERSAADARVPEGIREVIGRRLNRLSPAGEAVLQIAGVLGLQFQYSQLLSVFSVFKDKEVGEDDIVNAVEELVAAGFVAEEGGQAGEYGFTHALIREVVMSELSLTRRAHLHAQVGKALELHYGAYVDAHAAEMAEHFVFAEAVLGSERLIRYSLLAGEKALASLAHENAAMHFSRGLESAEEELDPQTSGLLHLGLGKAFFFLEHFPPLKAMEHIRQAFDLLRGCGNRERAVEAACYFHYMRPEFYKSALELVDKETPEGVKLLIHLAYSLNPQFEHVLRGRERQFEESQRAYEQAAVITENLGLIALRARLFAFWHKSLVARGDFQGAIEKGRLARRLVSEANVVGYPTLRTLAIVLTSFGSAEESQRIMAEILAEAKYGPAIAHSSLVNQSVMIALGCGDWETARSLELPRRPNRQQDVAEEFNMIFATNRLLLCAETGEMAAAKAILDELVVEGDKSFDDGRPFHKRLVIAAGIIHYDRIVGDQDYLDLADSLTQWVLSRAVEAMTHGESVTEHALMAKANIAIIREDKDQASHLYDTHEARRYQPWLVFEYPDHLLGRLARKAGNLDLALEHLEKAHHFLREGGWRPRCAWAGYDWAEALIARGTAEDRGAAAGLLEDVHKQAQSLGMLPLMDRAASLLDQAGPHGSKKEYPSGLTQREVEVLRLGAQGFTDQDVADRLFIAPKTASNHVSNILHKTGSANRTEAATYATKQGLLEPEA